MSPTARAVVASAATEAEWQATLIAAARAAGWWVMHHHDSRGTEPGWPDLTCIRGKELVYIECKSERGRLTGPQMIVLGMLAETGTEVIVARPSDVDVIDRLTRARVT